MGVATNRPRLCGGARVTRCNCSARHRRPTVTEYEFSYSPTTTNDRQDVLLRDYPAGQDYFRARAAAGCRTARLHQRPGRAPEHGPLSGVEALPLLRQTISARNVPSSPRRLGVAEATAT